MANVISQARVKNVQISPFKVRPLADLIRGASYQKAQYMLKGSPTKASRILVKLLASAYANALYKDTSKDFSENKVYINTIMVDGSGYRKLFWPRSHGRADILHRRFSSVYVELSDEQRKKGRR